MVSRTHSEALAAALNEVGARAELRLIPGADHGWQGVSDAAVEDIFTHSLRFARHLVT
jgi:acetyl esterase/lipase